MAAAPTPRFMHFNKANIKCLLINILGHDIIHDYGPSMVDRWESNKTIVTQFSADRYTMMDGRGMMGGMFSVSGYGHKRKTSVGFINPAAKMPKETLLASRVDWETKKRMEQTTSQIYSQVRINEGIITDQIGNAMLFSFFGNVMYYLYLNQKITAAAAAAAGATNEQIAQDFYNSLPANVQLKIRTFIAQNYNIPAQNVQESDVQFIAQQAVVDALIYIAKIFHEDLNIFDAQLFSLSDNMYRENFAIVNNVRQIIPRDIFTSVEESFSLYVRTNAPGGAPYHDELAYQPAILNNQPPYNLPAITYTHFFDLFNNFTKDNLSFTQPSQAVNQAIVVIDGAGKIDGAIMNSYGLTPSNQRQFRDSLQPLQYPNLNIDALIIMASNPQVLNVGGKKNINQSGGADPALDRAQSEALIDEIGLLLRSLVPNAPNDYSVANVNIANPANVNANISIFREIVTQYNNYVAAADDAAIQACVTRSVTPLVYNAGVLNVAQSGYYELIKLLRNEFNALFLNVAGLGVVGARPPQPSKSAAMFNDYKMFSDIKRNKLRNLPDEQNFIKTFYLRISNLLDSYRVIVSKHIDSQRQAQARADADVRKALLGELTDADKAVLGDFCTFMARAALTCTDIIDTLGIVKLPNVWSPDNVIMPQPPPIKTFEWWGMQQQQVKSATLTDYYTRKGLNAAAVVALPAPFNNVLNWGARIDSIEARRAVPPPVAGAALAAGGVNNYYLSSVPPGQPGQPVVRQVGSQALAKETSILLYIAGYAGYGIIGNIDRNIISDTNYWLGWNDISSASLDDMLIQFIRDSVGAAYNFPAIEREDRILNATNMFCKLDSRKYIINNAAGSRPGNVKAHEFCPYSSILDGMSMCGWNSSVGSGRESGNMDFCYIGATDFNSILSIQNNNLATTQAQMNTTSYYQGKSTLTSNDQLLADDIAIQLNIRPNDNWPFPPINVNVTTNISSNNNLDAKVVLGTTLKTYITRIIGGTIQGAAVPSLDPAVLDVIFNTGTLLHSGMGMAANSTKSGIFTRLFQYYNDVQFAYAVAAGNAAAALPPAPLSAPSFINFYQDWVYGEITKKGIGDIFQEVNAMCKYGGYSLIRPNNVIAVDAAAAAYIANRGTYRVSTERIISYLESPATQNTPIMFTMPAQSNYTRIMANANAAAPNPTGDQLRLFIAEDRPSGFRAGFVRKFGRGDDINRRASGGYFDGTAQGSFIVRPHNMNFCDIPASVVFGGSTQNRKTRKYKKIVKTKKNMKMRKGRKTRIRGNPIKRMKLNVPRKRITKKVN
jgi:hypothetical protein